MIKKVFDVFKLLLATQWLVVAIVVLLGLLIFFVVKRSSRSKK